MKCPKCGYISFDFNHICPKCNKDIGDEQKKINMPAFKPDPPFLLETLTRNERASGIGLGKSTFVKPPQREPLVATAIDDMGSEEQTSVFEKGMEGFKTEMHELSFESSSIEMGDSIEEDISAVDLSQLDMNDELKEQDDLTWDLERLQGETDTSENFSGAAGEGGASNDAHSEGKLADKGALRDAAFENSSDEEITLDLDEWPEDDLETALSLHEKGVHPALKPLEVTENAADLEGISLEADGEFAEKLGDFFENASDVPEKKR